MGAVLRMRRPVRGPKVASRGPAPRSADAVPLVKRLRMPSRRDAVAPMVERVLAAVAPAALDGEQSDDLAVALAEALSNAAVHGNHLRADAPVRVGVAVMPGRCAVIDVADSGNGFDVASVSDPTDDARLLEPGGRGVFLMRRLVDELEYNRAGNRVRMTIRTRRR